MRPIRRILAATDFSPDSEEAARYAVELARSLGAQVTLLHVFQPPMYPRDPATGTIAAAQLPAVYQLAREALEQAASTVEAALAQPVETQLVDDSPAEGILRAAREGDFDLIAMGTHGRTGLKHLLMGSVAERVVRYADRPVLTVHEAAH